MEIDGATRAFVFRALPRKFAAKLFAHLEPQQQDSLLRQLSTQDTNVLLSDLNPDDRTELLEEMPAEVTKRLLGLLSPEDLKEARQLLGYPVDSAGRVMTPDYVAIRQEWTIGDALQYIREHGGDKETIDIIYITDEEGKLLGDVKLKYLIFAKPTDKVEQVTKNTSMSLSAYDDQEKAVQMIKKLNLVALPVVDSEGILLGIVTVDDLIDVEEEEVTEDFQKLAGVSVAEGDLSLANIAEASVKLLYRKRVVWLLLLVFMNIFSGAAIAHFQGVISHSLALVFFLPLLIGSGGNAGSQAATLMVRALGVGDVKLGDWAKLIGKEVIVSSFLGFTLALGVSLIGFVRGGIDIALVVALAMLCIVVFGSLVGVALPFILTKLKRDPATASGPLMASIADICGIIIYFSIAAWILM